MGNNEMHLAQDEEAKNILELGFCLIQAYQRLKSFLEEAEKMLDGTKLHINEIVILHIIRIHNKPKAVNVIYLIADFYDDYVIAYAIKKLVKLKLIKKLSSKGSTNGTSYQITEQGIKLTNNYVSLRKQTLFAAFQEGNINTKELGNQLRLLIEVYIKSFRNLVTKG
jgi:predicted MarR family transcription regulator